MNLTECNAIVESAKNPHALRFETLLNSNHPLWVEGQIAKIAQANACSTATALMIASTSWGLHQLLGANVYAQGYASDIADFLSCPDDQEKIFSSFIAAKGFTGGEDVTAWDSTRFLDFATFYNGPGAPQQYVAAMQKAVTAGA